jgi:hypothetical protein
MSKPLEEAARRLMEAARAFLWEAQAESERAQGPVTITLPPRSTATSPQRRRKERNDRRASTPAPEGELYEKRAAV